MSAGDALLAVERLSIEYFDGSAWVNVVNGVDFSLGRGEIFGIAGESGSGKSTVAFALLGHLRAGSRIAGGSVRFEGRDLLTLPRDALQSVRGRSISFVPQNPTTSLTPSISIGTQIGEVLRFHRMATPGGIRKRVVELCAAVGLPDPETTVGKYPHQLSGGQQQRVLIAMAIACHPALIVLDEPTTGLDVTTQRRILLLLGDLRREYGCGFVYVSHDLGALSEICDRIGIMYAGELVEFADAGTLFSAPRHPYTQGLIASVPRIDAPPDRSLALKGILKRNELGAGCRFAPRCRLAEPACNESAQHLAGIAAGHVVACRRWTETALPGATFGMAS